MAAPRYCARCGCPLAAHRHNRAGGVPTYCGSCTCRGYARFLLAWWRRAAPKPAGPFATAPGRAERVAAANGGSWGAHAFGACLPGCTWCALEAVPPSSARLYVVWFGAVVELVDGRRGSLVDADSRGGRPIVLTHTPRAGFELVDVGAEMLDERRVTLELDDRGRARPRHDPAPV